MDAKRAKEIVASPVMVNVTHQGVPIYIESIMDDTATVNIHPLDKPNSHQKVNVADLKEH